MQEFLHFFYMGMRHVLNVHGYEHILFLIALLVPFEFKDWKKILILITLFTLGNTISLLLSVYGVVYINQHILNVLIPVLILVLAFFHLFTAGKSGKGEGITFIYLVTLFFGIIHGLGFATHFKNILGNSTLDKLLPLLEFSTGIEAGQLVVVLVVLILSYIVQTFFRFSKRDWTLVMAAFVIGVVLPTIVESPLWIR